MNNEVKILVYYTDGEYKIYPVIAKWLENGKEKEEPTNTPSSLESMVSSNPIMSNFTMEPFYPTQEQLDRLKEINDAYDEEKDSQSITAVNNFVVYGYVDYSSPIWMVNSLLPKHEGYSKELLINSYKEKIASLRYDREVSGLEYNGKIVKTDRESQATITSTLTMLNMGIVETVNFKCDNDEWLTDLNLDQFKLLSTSIAGHVNACFTAETMVIEELRQRPLKYLRTNDNFIDLEMSLKDIPEGKDVKTLEEAIEYINDTLITNGYRVDDGVNIYNAAYPCRVITREEDKAIVLANTIETYNTMYVDLETMFNKAYMVVISKILGVEAPSLDSVPSRYEDTIEDVDNNIKEDIEEKE